MIMMSLRRTTVLLIAGLLAGTGMLIGSIAYFTTRHSIIELRDSLIAQTTDAVSQRMESYFGQAAPALLFVDRLLTLNPKAMETDHWQDIGLQMALFLDSQLEITWIYFAEVETGNLLGAVRDSDGRLLFTRIHVDSDRIPVTMEVTPEGKIRPATLTDSLPDGYDARTRPWFTTGMQTPANTVAWTSPYQFLQSETRGVTATLTRRNAADAPVQILGADLDLSETAVFMDSLTIGKTGAAFLVRSDGKFLASRGDRPGSRLEKLRDALRSQIGKMGEFSKDDITRIEFSHANSDYLAVFQPISKPGFFTSFILPKDDYLGSIRHNAWLTIILSVVILGIAGVLGVLLSRRVTEPLDQIAHDLREMGELRFPEGHLEFKSKIREIAHLESSVRKMKTSLLSFSRFVPKRLLGSLLAQGEEAKLGGELRRITVQFTDLAGFTKMSEALTPEESFEELHEFLEIITTEQHRFGGITSNFTGDGTLALFNAPDDQPGHEAKAVEAALSCVRALEICNRRRISSRKDQLIARIGINTAEVLVGNLGTSVRFTYTAVGDGVNLCSRMEGLNKLYGTQILVGKETQEAAEDKFEWRMVDRLSVVGRSRLTELFEPLGHTGKTDERKIRMATAYESALSRYFSGEFAEAISKFEAVAREWPDDGPTAVLLKRCKDLLKKDNPTIEWDGSFTAPFK